MLQQQLEENGISVKRMHLTSLKTAYAPIKEAALFGGGVFISADLNVLQALGEANLAVGNKLSLYGMGFHTGIHRLLEKGSIQATVAHRSYEAGNFSMEMVLKALRNIEIPKKKVTVESALVTAENLYSVEVESIIFPHI
jgi:ABC-type sugar transport system substrate-binding protein